MGWARPIVFDLTSFHRKSFSLHHELSFCLISYIIGEFGVQTLTHIGFLILHVKMTSLPHRGHGGIYSLLLYTFCPSYIQMQLLRGDNPSNR